MKTTLLAAVAAVGFAIASANAHSAGNSGYAYPDFWGNNATQQAPVAKASPQTSGAAIGIYTTQSSHGTWLFPPDPNSSGGNS